jgi:hypothetical protein
VTLTWAAPNATSCVGTGGGGPSNDSWDQIIRSAYGSEMITESTDPAPGQSETLTFTITCTSSNSNLSASASVKVVQLGSAATTSTTPTTGTTASTPPPKSGGGGALDLLSLIFLLGVLGVPLANRRARAAASFQTLCIKHM